MTTTAPLLLDIDAACDYAGLDRSRIYPLLMSGRITSLKFGRRRYVPREAIEAFVREEIERQTAEVRSDAAAPRSTAGLFGEGLRS